MKRGRWAIMALLALGIGAASVGFRALSLEELRATPQYPFWANPKPGSYESGKPWKLFGDSRKSATTMKRNTGKLRHVIDHQPEEPDRPFLLLQLGRHFADLEQDAAAYHHLKALIDLPKDTPYNHNIWGLASLEAVKTEGEFHLARVLARNGHRPETLAALEAANPQSSYERLRQAEILALFGDADGAGKLLATLTGDGHPERNFSEAFVRLRAAVLARSLGRDDLAAQLSEPILKRGMKAEKGSQWQASWAIMDAAVKLSKTGKAVDFANLKDGTYTGDCRGFIDNLKVKAEVRNGRLESLKVLNARDDRPWSATETVPSRIVNHQRLAIDGVTGATVTSSAIIIATDQALQKAVK